MTQIILGANNVDSDDNDDILNIAANKIMIAALMLIMTEGDAVLTMLK